MPRLYWAQAPTRAMDDRSVNRTTLTRPAAAVKTGKKGKVYGVT